MVCPIDVRAFDLIVKNSKMNIFLISLTFTLALSQLPDQPPPKFALLTVTHTRNNSYEIIKDYLRHYTESQCYEKMISEICIVWNNQLLPEDAGVMDRELYWRVPVLFYLTKNNSLNHRFRVPKEATADVFYSLDDDIRVDCQTLNITYGHYLNATGTTFSRIISNQVRNYGYFPDKKTEFFYQGHSYAKFYSIAETGASFYPKHYLNLYYLKLEELNALREKVQNITSCEDIFFMAATQHFYPELDPQYYHPTKQYKNTDPKIGLSKKAGLVPLRTSCISYLTQVFGYNPLRHFNKDSAVSMQNWQFPNINLIMQTKIKGLINVEMIDSQQRTVSNFTNRSEIDSASVKNNDVTSLVEKKQQEDKEVQEKDSKQTEEKQEEKKQPQQMRTKHQKQVMIQDKQEKDKKNMQDQHDAEEKTKIVNQESVKQQNASPSKEQSTQEQYEETKITKPNKTQDQTQRPLSNIASHSLARKKFEIIVFLLTLIIISLLFCICRLWKMHKELEQLRSQGQTTAIEQEEVPIMPDQQ